MEKNLIRYYLSESRRWFRDCSSFRKEAKSRFQREKPPFGSYSDYLKALFQHRFTYDEYMNYTLWERPAKLRSEFVSMAEMEMVYRKLVRPSVKQIFNNKVAFLRRFDDFVMRKWVYVPEGDQEDVRRLLTSTSCILKPVSGHSGFGIRKIEQLDDSNWAEFYKEISSKDLILEECVTACDEIASFHPASLNTIRVVTLSKDADVRFIGAILRMGAHNSCIDNTHAGGVFAQIDVASGVLVSDGVDTEGNHYIAHPDSGKKIKGTQIPFWNQVVDLCIRAAQVVPDLCFAGWDICVREGGRVELIEANAAPHFDGGMQVPLKKGVREEVSNALRELYDIENLI